MSTIDREIAEQPEILERLLTRETRHLQRLANQLKTFPPEGIFLVARGSSDHAGIYAKYLLGTRNGLVVALAAPSLFTLYRRPPNLSRFAVLAISQSGASDDLCQVMADARRQGAFTIVLTNTDNSPITRGVHEVIPLHAGKEYSVAATKTYTAELMVLAMLSVALDGSRVEQKALRAVPSAVARIVRDFDRVRNLTERYRFMDRLAVIGRGFNYATAFEIALKLKELAYVTAEPSSSADFRHGPIAVVAEGFPVLLVAPRGRSLQDLQALGRALRKRQAELLVISSDRKLIDMAHTCLPMNDDLPEWLSPLTAVVPGQMFARTLAMLRGCPVDKPRGLSKVTRTR